MDTGKLNARGNPAMDYHPIQGGVEILLVASCYRNWDKLRPGGPLGLYADFTLPLPLLTHRFGSICFGVRIHILKLYETFRFVTCTCVSKYYNPEKLAK